MIINLPQSQPKAVNLFEDGSIGLFEIDDAGTVLYCRTSAEKPASVSGFNFFDEVAPFENMAEFRRRFNGFIKSHISSKSFSFNCRINGEIVPAKILLVRIIERSDNERADAIIVDIRKI